MYYNAAAAAEGPRGEYFPDIHEIFTPVRTCLLPRNGNVAENSNHKITFEVPSAREELEVVQILASYPADHLGIQGRGMGPLLDSM